MIWLCTIFLIALIMGLPAVFSLGISALGYFVLTGQSNFLLVLPQRMFAGVDQFVLLAIPLFVLAGNLMDVGGLTRRLLDFANVWVGRFRGGTSLTTIWGSFFLSGVGGSAAADAAAIGSVLIPEMKRQGYDVNYSAALVAASSLMGPLIPPSIAMVIYGALSGTSISRLLIAGIVPGIMLAIGLTLYAVWVAHRNNYSRLTAPTVKQMISATITAIPVILLPVIIIVGIRGGIFTATEAAAVATVYALLIAGVFYRALSWDYLRTALLNTAVLSAAIYLLIAMAHIVAFIFALERVPETVVNALFTVSDNRYVILLLVNLSLLMLGMVLDVTGILILTVPALIGIGHALGLDPVHLGVMVVFNVLIGFIHPPIGLCLFIVSSIAKQPIEKVALATLPMIAIALAILAIIALFPDVVLFLPNTMVGQAS